MSARVAAAFAAHLVLAAGAGSLLFLPPPREVEAVVAVLMARRRGATPADLTPGSPARGGAGHG